MTKRVRPAGTAMSDGSQVLSLTVTVTTRSPGAAGARGRPDAAWKAYSPASTSTADTPSMPRQNAAEGGGTPADDLCEALDGAAAGAPAVPCPGLVVPVSAVLLAAAAGNARLRRRAPIASANTQASR